LRALGIGDLLTAVPALRALRRNHPYHELVLAAPPELSPLVAATGAVDRLHPTRSYVRRPPNGLGWRGRRPDLAVNLHGSGPHSHRALLATEPLLLLGYRCPDAGQPDGPLWSDGEHEVARWCRLLRWAGIPADPTDLSLPAPPSLRTGVLGSPAGTGKVVIHPGASAPERRWPVDRYAAVARALAADGYPVVVTGSPAEVADAQALADQAGLPADAILAGRTDVAQLARLVAGARLVICGDTGVAHLATAYGTPSVVLFGPASPATWGPPPERTQHIVLWHEAGGLARISTAEVSAAADRLLSPGVPADAAPAR
jgi:ADP-heptose:LPS heptosyltransferase